jgi:hypothetical protein
LSATNIGGLVGRISATNININNIIVNNIKIRSTNAFLHAGIGGAIGEIGINSQGEISNIKTSVDIDVNNVRYVGGVVGFVVSDVIIKKIKTKGKVKSNSGFVGGLIGRMEYATIEQSKSIANVSGTTLIGGICGAIINNAKISTSKNTGIINGSIEYVGGVLGRSFSLGDSTENSFSCGKVSGLANVGGLIGSNSGTVTNSYYDFQSAGITAGTGNPRTTAQLQTALPNQYINPNGTIDGTNNAANLMYAGWDRNKWLFGPRSKYPRLKREI